jgi:RNA polymerase sigma-70 factor (ECF subfamily)
MDSDAQLVDRVRGGDIEAFRGLVERYERTVLAVVLAELRDLQAAEDVTQTSLLLAYRRLDTLREAKKFAPWLLQIARHQAIELLRKRQVPVAATGDAADRPCDLKNPGLADDCEDLLRLVERLPEHERLLVGLRYFDGHSVADIAEITGRPLGTVTKQLSRAHARLRAWLIEDKQ